MYLNTILSIALKLRGNSPQGRAERGASAIIKKPMIYKEKIITWLENRKRDKAIRNIRETMMMFGCDLSPLSDEEIEERILEACKIIQSAGITVEEPVKDFD